jgi:hypothetical protein
VSCTAEHAELALAIARDLGRDTEGADFALDSLAIGLRRGGVRVEIGAISRLCASFAGGDALLLPDVLRARAGDPAGVALVAAAAAQRARLAVDVVAAGERLLLAHPGATLVVDPASGEILDGRELGVDLHWRCAHETVATVLDRVAEHAERAGEEALAMAARAVALTLPLEDDSRTYRVNEHRRLLARLN